MNKKLLSLSLFVGLLFSTNAYAQLPVSTAAENKNVVLEEFTGIYCGFCPAGHLIATNFKAANPSDVVLINVHAGPFANPSGSDPDFTTNFGDSIDIISDVAGYPAGNINRRVFSSFSMNPGGMAMGRGNWVSAGNTILGESAYANVALEGDIDIATNILTVDVEIYFSGAATGNVNLNIALLQNNIVGPQSGSSGNTSQVNSDGTYNHQHMLRNLLTGQWGEVITTTTMGTTVTRQYVYTIPAMIDNIPVSIGDLELAAFVVEGQTEIITGANGPITFTAPAGAIVADLGATAGVTATSDYCDANVTPEMMVTNNGNAAVSNFDVSYSINNGTPVTQNVTASLAASGTTTITFPATTLGAGLSIISYEVSTANNASLFDLTGANNISASDAMVLVAANPFGTFHSEDFESYNLNDESFVNSHTLNPDGNGFGVLNQTLDPSITASMGGFGNSENAVYFDFYNTASGGDMTLLFDKLNLSATTGNSIEVEVAYAQYTTENDRLEIMVSDDCGASWSSVFNKAGNDLSTTAASTPFFIPTSADWRKETVDISSFDGTAELLVQFVGTSAYGNNLYLDNIQFRNNTYVSLDENALASGLKFFPNPADDVLNFELDLATEGNVEVRILDLTGREVMLVKNEELEAGDQKFTASVSHLVAGSYLVEIRLGNSVSVQKLILK